MNNKFIKTCHLQLGKRFRGFLPVVVDLETGGLDPSRDAILEIAAKTINMNSAGEIYPDQLFAYHVLPFEGAHVDPKALEINRIDPYHPFRFAEEEKNVLTDLFEHLQTVLESAHCERAILVGHNAWFDLLFLKSAVKRHQLTKYNLFHNFSCFDTATLSGLAFGQTVLARATAAAGISFNQNEAHSAIYDVEKTAELFCYIVNHWRYINLNFDLKNKPCTS